MLLAVVVVTASRINFLLLGEKVFPQKIHPQATRQRRHEQRKRTLADSVRGQAHERTRQPNRAAGTSAARNEATTRSAMGKSLRAKTKVRARGIKRAAVFEPVYKARTARLAEKIGAKAAEEPAEAAAADSMEVEGAEAKSISTSGWKGSRNEQWKQKKASKLAVKKRAGNKSLVFSTSKGTKGKSKRK
ncbi:uncharacterized protein V1510DRAFT_421735 [Dipodascopsis tothii]|uniref:uncharacterized protein n=1 Tax=Dipodascopsis tothii TaxID=44089 RepID=UPI0034CF3A96